MGADNSVSRGNANQIAGKMFPRLAELMGDLNTAVAPQAHQHDDPTACVGAPMGRSPALTLHFLSTRTKHL
jgi:hypothetical protein